MWDEVDKEVAVDWDDEEDGADEEDGEGASGDEKFPASPISDCRYQAFVTTGPPALTPNLRREMR